jgi:uncharacterized membrane protein YjgN (DUF898 family)
MNDGTVGETDVAGQRVIHPFDFTGSAGDYFRIWIVSLCLSLLTLGIYSAWGKVRKRRYLYAHTRLAGSGFEYRASPLAILKGRVIAILLFGGFAVMGHVSVQAQLAFAALLIILLPWLVVATARFNARNSTWRSIRFAFDGRLREAVKVFLGWGVVAVVTLGIGYPYYRMRRAQFVVARHRYGATAFATDFTAGPFYVAYLVALAMIIGIAIVFVVISVLLRSAAGSFAAVPFMYAGYIVAYAYISGRTGNIIQNGTTVGPMRLTSSLRARDLSWLYLTNIIAVLATLGLATAWATIRVARYRAERLVAVTHAPLGSLLAAEGHDASATASEVSDLFDVDVSL